MWSKTLFLGLRVRIGRRGRRGIRLFLTLAAYPLGGFLLACDPALSLLPGRLGERARAAADAAHAAVYAVMESKPQTFVHVQTESAEEQVLVDLGTWGFRAGEEYVADGGAAYRDGRGLSAEGGYMEAPGPEAPGNVWLWNPWLFRLLGCWAALLVSTLLWGSFPLPGILWGGALLTLLYGVVRPLLQAVLLPLNLLLAGILTPLTDAWLVLWAGAWSGAALTYWQAALTAAWLVLLYLPYSAGKRRRLLGGWA